MKKKFLKTLTITLTALTVVYTVVAFVLIHGLGIYRLGTIVGRILASSWQYFCVAALVLLLCSGLILVKSKREQEEKIPTAAPQDDAVLKADNHLKDDTAGDTQQKQRKNKKSKASSERKQVEQKILPAAPLTPDTELIPETNLTQQLLGSTETVPLSEAGQTELIPSAGEIQPATEQTTVETMVLPMETEILSGEPVVLQEEIPYRNSCPQCGANTKPGAKFCVKCGTRLGG